MTDDTTPHEPHLAATEPSELTSVAAHVVPSIRHFLTTSGGCVRRGT